jgi:16S rRNA (guanine(966)-N(2))-methyltransferase RsmD
MRVISGQAKGRRLRAVPGDRTRPITDRVKQSLFDTLGNSVVGSHFLDLFAGTGSVGIEALSRGAARVVFVERNARAVQVIRHNLQVTQLADRARVARADVFAFLSRPCAEEAPFDFVYVAPPQYRGLWIKTVLTLDAEGLPLLSDESCIIVQIHPKEYSPFPLTNLELTEQRNYGSTLLCFYQSVTSSDE